MIVPILLLIAACAIATALVIDRINLRKIRKTERLMRRVSEHYR